MQVAAVRWGPEPSTLHPEGNAARHTRSVSGGQPTGGPRLGVGGGLLIKDEICHLLEDKYGAITRSERTSLSSTFVSSPVDMDGFKETSLLSKKVDFGVGNKPKGTKGSENASPLIHSDSCELSSSPSSFSSTSSSSATSSVSFSSSEESDDDVLLLADKDLDRACEGEQPCHVRVECESGEVIGADHVIVTSSIGFLRSRPDFFVPSLGESHEKAVDEMGFGNVAKVRNIQKF